MKGATYLARIARHGRVRLIAIVPGQHVVELARHGGRELVHPDRVLDPSAARFRVAVRLLDDRLDGVMATVSETVPEQTAGGLTVRARVVRAHYRYELLAGVFKALTMITIIITIIIIIIIIIVIIIIIIIVIGIIINIIIGTVGAARPVRGTSRIWRARALVDLAEARRLPEGHVHQLVRVDGTSRRRVPRSPVRRRP